MTPEPCEVDDMPNRIFGREAGGQGVPPWTAAGPHYPRQPEAGGGPSVDWKSAAREFILLRPEVALGIALAVGVTLGWLIKRR